ncbi:MAG TPA: bacillithiol biosynthesis cysteine-adding enzyme BshC [Thermoanaerobaculia bacterium]|nr:bacillithiol biosynthesis cysteine-adding enzyme BshC [Thermoanaerobaculia bacterium]
MTQTAIDLVSAGLLAGLPAALLEGRDRDLLAPLGWAEPGSLPPAPPAVDRREIAAALAATNTAYGHPAAARLAERLADPRTRVVVTGQQPGLLGGPLFTLVKARAAVAWAEALEAAGQPAVAVFWMATEDHDFTETARLAVPAPGGPRTLDLGEDPEPLVPLGARSVGAGVEAVLAELEALSEQPGWREAWGAAARWWRPAARFGEAFPRLLVAWLGERSPLFLDAQLPQLKAAERPILARFVERWREVDRAYAEATERVASRGYSPQVSFQSGALPLFLLAGGKRRRLEGREDGTFALRGAEREPLEPEELLAAIADNPLLVSPGVLARPVVQDAVLGTSVFVLGPGELSYMAQVAAAYPVVEVAPSLLALRPSAAVVEPKQLSWLAGLPLPLAQILGDRGALERRLAEGQGGNLAEGARARIASELDALREGALAIDAGLEGPWQKTREQVERALTVFGEKLTAAAARRDELSHRRIEQLREALLPGGRLQERAIAGAWFVARYGERFVPALERDLGLDPRILHLIRPMTEQGE